MARKMLVLVAALLLRNGEAPVLFGGKDLYDFHAREQAGLLHLLFFYWHI